MPTSVSKYDSFDSQVSYHEQPQERVQIGTLRVLQIASGAEHSALVTGKISCHVLHITATSQLIRSNSLVSICHAIIYHFFQTCTEGGKILTWGWGEHGQLGLGNTCDEPSPQTVRLSSSRTNQSTVFRVYCGSGYTCVVGTINYSTIRRCKTTRSKNEQLFSN